MRIRFLYPIVIAAAVSLLPPPPAFGTDPDPSTAEEAKKSADSRAEKLYKQGTKALDKGDWGEAAAAFHEASRIEGPRADGPVGMA